MSAIIAALRGAFCSIAKKTHHAALGNAVTASTKAVSRDPTPVKNTPFTSSSTANSPAPIAAGDARLFS